MKLAIPNRSCYHCRRKFRRWREPAVWWAPSAAGDRVFVAAPICKRCRRKLGGDQLALFSYIEEYLVDRRLLAQEIGEQTDPREFDAFRVLAAIGGL